MHNRTRTYYSSSNNTTHNNNNENNENENSVVQVEELEGLTPPRVDDADLSLKPKKTAETISNNNNLKGVSPVKSFLDSNSDDEAVLSVKTFRRSTSKMNLKS
ncbi:hypothetical protein ADEAN_000441400 [Angomonas deanei]|uniref:Uncharacterized protein n=1 Tax=Angomonas deanei TaxID=59799 RepID=A0A7G2CAW3_9TRYP|nr:hypothetical protein ADEAN_000441400 [Angomonas deanei]